MVVLRQGRAHKTGFYKPFAADYGSHRRHVPYYFAPEFFTESLYDPFAGDIWALGVTLYQTLYGKLPFTGKNLSELARSIRNDPVTFPKSHQDNEVKKIAHKRNKTRVDNNIDFNQDHTDNAVVSDVLANDLIEKMLEKDPAKRITLPEIWKHPWVTGAERCKPYIKMFETNLCTQPEIYKHLSFNMRLGSVRRVTNLSISEFVPPTTH